MKYLDQKSRNIQIYFKKSYRILACTYERQHGKWNKFKNNEILK